MITQPLTIVICDDETLVRRALRMALDGEERFEVVAETENGHDGLEAARHWQPDFLLLDVSMPDADGFHVLERLREAQLPTRCVMLSAIRDDEMRDRALALGAVAYIDKGANLAEISGVLLSLAET